MTTLTTKVVLFADVAGSTELYAIHGPYAASAYIGKSLNICQAAVLAEGGRVVKFLGDGILAAFDQSDDAVRAAIEIQRQHDTGEIRFKIGVDAGEVVDVDADLFGDVVGLASRLCDKARKGEIIASQAVIAGTTLDIVKSSQKPLWVKGYIQPISVYSVEWGKEAADYSTRIVFGQNVVPSRARVSGADGVVQLMVGVARPEILIGRTESDQGKIDLPIPRGSVSREHALIRWTGGNGFYIYDTSKNGTYIRTSKQGARQIHRSNFPLDQTSWISFGEELPCDRYDILFELIDFEN